MYSILLYIIWRLLEIYLSIFCSSGKRSTWTLKQLTECRYICARKLKAAMENYFFQNFLKAYREVKESDKKTADKMPWKTLDKWHDTWWVYSVYWVKAITVFQKGKIYLSNSITTGEWVSYHDISTVAV